MEQPTEPSKNPQEETIFNEAEFSMQGYDKHIRTARILLFIIAFFQLVSIWLEGELPDEIKWIVIGIHIFLSAVFVALGIWSKYRPYPALITATVVYVGLYALIALLDPSSMFSGILIKIVVVVFLILGIRNAREAEIIKKTFGK